MFHEDAHYVSPVTINNGWNRLMVKATNNASQRFYRSAAMHPAP
jgi:IS1 family transposase